MDLEACVDVVPWMLFVVVDRQSGLGLAWAAASAMGCGAAIAGWSHWRQRRTPIGWLSIGVFGALVVVALIVDRPAQWFEPTLRAASVSCLGVAALVSLRWRPLSEGYTVERVPVHRQAELGFARVNRRITVAWGIAALCIGGSFAAEALTPSAVALTVFDWVVPLLVLGVTLRFVALQWSTYQVSSESTEPTSLGGASLGFVGSPTLERHDEALSTSPERRVTYLPGVQPGS